MSKELDLAELGLAFLGCFAALAIYIIVALSPAMAQGQGSCWQCMHGCNGRDAEVCGKSGSSEYDKHWDKEIGDKSVKPVQQSEVKVSTNGLRAAITRYDANAYISDDDVRLWNHVLRELSKLESRLKQ